jgi:hypothetical protein
MKNLMAIVILLCAASVDAAATTEWEDPAAWCLEGPGEWSTLLVIKGQGMPRLFLIEEGKNPQALISPDSQPEEEEDDKGLMLVLDNRIYRPCD